MGFLRKSPEGTHIGQIKDAYLSVTADITRLQKEVIFFWGPGQHLPRLVALLIICCRTCKKYLAPSCRQK